MATSLETRSLLDELRSFDKGGFFDLGHPLLNRIAESFVKAAGIGAIKGVAREGCYLALEGNNLVAGTKSRSSSTDISAKNNKKNPFPYLRGEEHWKGVPTMGCVLVLASPNRHLLATAWLPAYIRESHTAYKRLVALMIGYDQLLYLQKNSAVAGALTGMTVALTCEKPCQEHVLQCAITGAALSTAANLLTGVF
ncbi:hypothetical protein Godav_016546 [Gossypium davidsonii]|uniref:Uncharacterized protein n=1 Tax=Gossypium davidsonii TaxID=34287 RepID=A0A7J8RSC5_GOSDV|nr:hypothetical protein [Gossypium davidsonii]